VADGGASREASEASMPSLLERLQQGHVGIDYVALEPLPHSPLPALRGLTHGQKVLQIHLHGAGGWP